MNSTSGPIVSARARRCGTASQNASIRSMVSYSSTPLLNPMNRAYARAGREESRPDTRRGPQGAGRAGLSASLALPHLGGHPVGVPGGPGLVELGQHPRVPIVVTPPLATRATRTGRVGPYGATSWVSSWGPASWGPSARRPVARRPVGRNPPAPAQAGYAVLP